MSDRLEDFIRKNRSELDLDEPSAHIWNQIEHKIPNGKKRMLWSRLAVAASVMVLIVSAFLLGLNRGSGDLDQGLFASESEYNDFKEASDYYMTTIDHKLNEAKSIGLEEDVLNDLQQLDEVYEELKEEMMTTDYENKEILIGLMIKNYKTKIDILERIINKKTNDESKFTNDETISI